MFKNNMYKNKVLGVLYLDRVRDCHFTQESHANITCLRNAYPCKQKQIWGALRTYIQLYRPNDFLLQTK